MTDLATFSEFIQSRKTALSEGSIYERLRRDPNVEVDPFIFHASLVYDARGASVLEGVHREYWAVAEELGLPMVAFTDTWRSNQDRIRLSEFHDRPVNQDNAALLLRMRESYRTGNSPVYVGGQIGPRGDAYAPDEALTEEEAAEFHRPQIEALVEGGVDFLFAATFPAVSEACGAAQVMAETGLPYAISFVIRRDATILDGTKMADAIRLMDRRLSPAPIGYAVNCVYPSIFKEALQLMRQTEPKLVERIISFHANTSDLDPEELDGSVELHAEDPEKLASLICEIQNAFSLPILGGCCGTDSRHIACIGRMVQAGAKPEFDE